VHDEEERLREQAVRSSGVLTRGRDSDLASIVAFAARHYDMLFGGLSIITGRRQILLASIGTDIVETSRDASFCQVTIQRPGEPLIVQDARADIRFANLEVVTGEPHIRFYAGMPIVDRNGYALGALCIGDREPRKSLFDPTKLMIHAHEIERLLRW
jgi:GAF domain-containing protein